MPTKMTRKFKITRFKLDLAGWLPLSKKNNLGQEKNPLRVYNCRVYFLLSTQSATMAAPKHGFPNKNSSQQQRSK